MSHAMQTIKIFVLVACQFVGIAAAAEPEKAPTKFAITRVQQTPFLVRQGGELRSETVLTIANPDPARKAWVRISVADKPAVIENVGELTTANNLKTVHVPELTKDQEKVTFEVFDREDCAGQPLAATTLPQHKVRHWTIYVNHDMHQDIGYTQYQEDLKRTTWPGYLDVVLKAMSDSDGWIDASKARLGMESSFRAAGAGTGTAAEAARIGRLAALGRASPEAATRGWPGRWLSREKGMRATLPTEVQWEWVCRAGTATRFNFGDTLSDVPAPCNLADESIQGWNYGRAEPGYKDGAAHTAPVGKYPPNAWGLHEMHGNAAEWCLSSYYPYPYNPADGRDDPTTGEWKVVRGGSWNDTARYATSASRWRHHAYQPVYNVGFRIAVEIDGEVLTADRAK